MVEITNEEFKKALKKYQGLLHLITFPYGFIGSDEIRSCQLIGLWQCLRKCNRKSIIPYLYSCVRGECLKYLNSQGKEKVSENIEKSVLPHFDMLEALNDETKHLIHQRFFQNMTFKEIGNKNGYSHETARKRVQKALESLKSVYNITD